MSAAGRLASEADRAALARVLAGEEFQAVRWRGEELRRWLVEAWERLTEALGTTEATRWAGLGRLVFLTAVAVGLLLLWRAVRRRRVRGGPAARARPAVTAAPGGPAVAVADGERALAAGDLVAAVRLAFLAAAGAIQRRLRGGALDALTGSELADRLADDGFTRLARLHERTVFGRRSVTGDEAAAALEVAAGLASGRELAGPGVAP